MAAGPMKMRATLGNGYTDVRVLMTHPMETGQRKDPDGKHHRREHPGRCRPHIFTVASTPKGYGLCLTRPSTRAYLNGG